jgi:hypothetical protein
MKRIFPIIFIFLIASSYSIAQEATYEKAKKLYENFDSQGFLKMSDQLIKKGTLSDSLMINLYEMRAIVFYMNGDEQSIRKSFESILTIQKKYSPDPEIISDILIQIFKEVKTEYTRNHPEQNVLKDSTQVKQEIKVIAPHILRNAITQNILLPGLGHIYASNKTKGWITAVASVVNIGALSYFIFDTKSKEDAYLNETNKSLIQQKYNDYNSAYKTRNVLIVSYIAIWLYSQIDMLFFSNNFESSTVNQTSNLITIPSSHNTFQVGFQIPIK